LLTEQAVCDQLTAEQVADSSFDGAVKRLSLSFQKQQAGLTFSRKRL
jgi:hypothetical protein